MKPKIDDVDKKILRILLEDATKTYSDISKMIYVSTATVHLRVKNMRERGIIESTRIAISEEALGLDIKAFLGIYLEKSMYYRSVLEALNSIPEIVNVHYTTGKYNILAFVICRDTKHLNELLNYQIQQIKGVQSTDTFLSLDEPIDRNPFIDLE